MGRKGRRRKKLPRLRDPSLTAAARNILARHRVSGAVAAAAAVAAVVTGKAADFLTLRMAALAGAFAHRAAHRDAHQAKDCDPQAQENCLYHHAVLLAAGMPPVFSRGEAAGFTRSRRKTVLILEAVSNALPDSRQF